MESIVVDSHGSSIYTEKVPKLTVAVVVTPLVVANNSRVKGLDGIRDKSE